MDVQTEHMNQTDPYLVVSIDGHVGPSLEDQLRPYCPKQHLEQFDAYARSVKRAASQAVDPTPDVPSESDGEVRFEARGLHITKHIARRHLTALPGEAELARERSWSCPGQQDPHERHRDMDADGIVADVIFAGGQNGEVLPFLSTGFDHGPTNIGHDLRAVGSHIYNAWLADFVSVEPQRHVGVMQIAIGDVPGAVREIEWGRQAGLRAVNLPAPQRESAPYTDPMYEPLWAACEALDLPMVTHTGGGDLAHGLDGPMGLPLMQMEARFMSRRGLWQLILGGVFERHPGLRLMFVEQGVTWAEEALADLDSLYYSQTHAYVRAALSRPPSEYWAHNCSIGGSFLARYEVAVRDIVGVRNLCWGADYPHIEGTWPNTRLAMRNTFADVPEADTRLILGENAMRIFGLDEAALRQLADRIGPTPAELSKPLDPDEFPAFRGFAFRERGVVS